MRILLLIIFSLLSFFSYLNAGEIKTWTDKKGVTHIEINKTKDTYRSTKKKNVLIENKRKKDLSETSLPKKDIETNDEDLTKMTPGLFWGINEIKDSMTDEVERYIYICDHVCHDYFYIRKKPNSDCLIATFEVQYKLIHFEPAPIFRIDKFKAINVGNRSTKTHSNRSFSWAIGDCDKKLQEKIINQFIKGRELKIRFYEFPEGVWERNYPLVNFIQVYSWLTNIPEKKLYDIKFSK